MDVKKIQARLNELNFAKLPITGYYGPLTKAAVEVFQRRAGLVPVDGICGPKTLAALFPPEVRKDVQILKVSSDAIDLTIFSEVTSELVYRRKYSSPTYPGANSGVTIGIGYDLGYNTLQQIREDWQDLLDERTFLRLLACSTLKGEKARAKVAQLKDIHIPFSAAKQVFLERTLPRYAADAVRIYPGLDKLHPGAAGAIVDLVYNRGTSLVGDRRREMKALVPLIAAADYKGIAAELRSMRRLWDGIPEEGKQYEERYSGLVFRCEKRADLVDGTWSTEHSAISLLFI